MTKRHCLNDGGKLRKKYRNRRLSFVKVVTPYGEIPCRETR